MNILVKTASNKYIVRPDTTWERDNEDFFPPDFVDGLSFTPVLFARISKPGRSIGRNFASRYYDGINYGILLYPECLMDGSPEGFAEASCLDHTSFLPFPLYNISTLGRKENKFELKKNGVQIFSFNDGGAGMIEDALVEASTRIYVRSGDIIAIELSKRKKIAEREEGSVNLSALFCDNVIMDFRIIF